MSVSTHIPTQLVLTQHSFSLHTDLISVELCVALDGRGTMLEKYLMTYNSIHSENKKMCMLLMHSSLLVAFLFGIQSGTLSYQQLQLRIYLTVGEANKHMCMHTIIVPRGFPADCAS